MAITAIGVNKSADRFIVADVDEIRRRGEAGEFGRKDTDLGLDYRRHATDPAAPATRLGEARVRDRDGRRSGARGARSRRRSSGSTTEWG